MDFVTGLPECEGFDAILVVVDRLTKMRQFTACRTDCSAEDLTNLFIRDIFRLHGLPAVVVSDRGPQFASMFWARVCKSLQIDRRMSTAFHPQMDGQTEITNAAMEQYLRAYVSYQQDNWVSWLPMAEFAANNLDSETTRLPPFFPNYGNDLKMTITVGPASPNPEAVDAHQKTEAMCKFPVPLILKS
jgi:transposase InsO family protein